MKFRSERKVWNWVRLALFVLCAGVFLVSIFMVMHRQSALLYMAMSAAVALASLFWLQLKGMFFAIRRRRAGRVVINVIIVLVAILVLYAVVISVIMLSATGSAEEGGPTLIVLGCRVYGEQPSLMLSRRLDAALKYLNDNPDAIAVLAGGQGEGEFISEAEAMSRRLTANGISEDRLFLEDRSTSTDENIAFSKAVIEERGLSQNIIIVTDGFHQYRAQFHAKNAGLTVEGAVRANTPLYALPYYWLREIAAVTSQVVFGARNAA